MLGSPGRGLSRRFHSRKQAAKKEVNTVQFTGHKCERPSADAKRCEVFGLHTNPDSLRQRNLPCICNAQLAVRRTVVGSTPVRNDKDLGEK